VRKLAAAVILAAGAGVELIAWIVSAAVLAIAGLEWWTGREHLMSREEMCPTALPLGAGSA